MNPMLQQCCGPQITGLFFNSKKDAFANALPTFRCSRAKSVLVCWSSAPVSPEQQGQDTLGISLYPQSRSHYVGRKKADEAQSCMELPDVASRD